ncbi:PQQ-binding-like beta-propeller repeat protein [Polymorphospora rubra]|uniref:Pyrrolo-quinoline quinone repeat domain-containing protein n=1 Tax=Polymorphospora rubra TaxID=338584 RepID=A0A810N653_9ACTN|nr:PQQ-binding-like beta-propeller repeat protein [Polymorphospora rubra]BCJ68450.1 hypothetical protein Prubr_54710 [Polymorphospora rubra]
MTGISRRSFTFGASSLALGGLAATQLATPAVAAPAQPAAGTPGAAPAQPRSFGRTGPDFPQVCGDYGNQNHSTLKKITRQNVSRLRGAWRVDLEGGDTSQSQQSTAVAENGVIYVQTRQQGVYAVDGRTGAVKWRRRLSERTADLRGVALAEGRVFTTDGDNYVWALDKRTGEVIWRRQLLTADEEGDPDAGCDPEQGQCGGQRGVLAGAVIHYDNRLFIGMAGSTGGARGRAYCLNATDGRIEWIFWGAPGEGEYGNDTWAGDSWKTGGAVPWIHPAVDPDLNLVYWTFGNPYPRTDGSSREGANLFANSIVAIDIATGRRRWHFQSVHHDIWDYDNVMAPVLADLRIGNRLRKVVIYGSKTCYFYVLDRATGEPVHGMEERPVPQEARQKTWPTQPFPGGEPFVQTHPTYDNPTRPVPFYPWGGLYDVFWDRATILYPGAGGGADWSHNSFNPRTGLLYTGYGLINSSFSNTRGGRVNTARPFGQGTGGGIVATDPRTNTVVWRKPSEWSLAHGNGILTTDGGVMFQGGPDGVLHAMDDTNGKTLWSWQTGAGVATSPITYEVDGEQYVAVLAGGNGLPYRDVPRGDFLWAFKIGGKVPPAPAPTPPSKVIDITAAAVAGSAVNFTVTLGRTWDAANRRPAAQENTVSTSAMAPQHLTVRVGDTVTFVNPADNTRPHSASSFFESEWDTDVLQPGESATHTFTRPGTYFYNDCVYPQSTGKIVVTK